jgi:hypothetical protein
MTLARSVKPAERKVAQKKCDIALAAYRFVGGRRLDRERRLPT